MDTQIHDTPKTEADKVSEVVALDELDLDAMFAGVERDEAVVEHEEVGEDEEAALEVVGALDEAYEEQPVSTASVEAADEPEAPAAATPKKTRAKGTPRVAKDVSDLPADAFVLTTVPPADLAANKATVLAKRPTQKKIAEKFDNLFQSIAAGKAPSVYVRSCFAVLDEKKTVTSSDLVAALRASEVGVGKSKGSTYNEGTARSQAGQIMVLFNAVGIADRDKQTLTLNDDSKIADYLRDLA